MSDCPRCNDTGLIVLGIDDEGIPAFDPCPNCDLGLKETPEIAPPAPNPPGPTAAEIVEQVLAKRPENQSVRQQTLDAAKQAVADRGLNYGTPEDNFQRIADLWTAFNNRQNGVEIQFDPSDVAIMLALVKIARLANTPAHVDSWVDLAGYAACGAEVAAKK